jgi:hypothetical protein
MMPRPQERRDQRDVNNDRDGHCKSLRSTLTIHLEADSAAFA